jgi:transglutaminase-like putative cysteine protease
VSAEREAVVYAIDHATEYDYGTAVSVSHHIARLTPRTLPWQACKAHVLDVDPPAAVVKSHVDYYGNTLTFFATQSAHTRLSVRARSRVVVEARTDSFDDTPAWEIATDRTRMPLEALDGVLDPAAGRASAALVAGYARTSFPPGRDLIEAVADLTARIHRDFAYDPHATTVETPLSDVFEARRGVCQDFTRLEVACLRSMGIPARYVSGYLETLPPPGTPRLVGADASHAWVSFHCPEIGWIDTDPTNNLLPCRSHITLAWGHDFTDVSPIRGVILGGGDHSPRVSVDVRRLSSDDPAW